MRHKLGIDVGGTFTDFLLMDEEDKSMVNEVASAPVEPAIGVLNGLEQIALMSSSKSGILIHSLGMGYLFFFRVSRAWSTSLNFRTRSKFQAQGSSS